MRPGPSLILALLAVLTMAASAEADIRKGKLTSKDLSAHHDFKHIQTKERMKPAAPACAWISSSNPEEAALARRLTLLGLCLSLSAPSDEAEPSQPDQAAPGPTIRQGYTCSVIGKVGQSC